MNVKDAKTGKILKKRFPLTTEIGRLKYLVIRLFKYSTEDADEYKLIYTTPEVSWGTGVIIRTGKIIYLI